MNTIETETRPWGRFFVLQDESKYKLKRVEVNSGQRSSYKFHHHRSVAWTMVLGEAAITLDGDKRIYKRGDTILIPQGDVRRTENNTEELVVFNEVQTENYFREDDIVRIEDDYNRT